MSQYYWAGHAQQCKPELQQDQCESGGRGTREGGEEEEEEEGQEQEKEEEEEGQERKKEAPGLGAHFRWYRHEHLWHRTWSWQHRHQVRMGRRA